MLQFNLLPDVKKEYIKAKRQKRLIVSISALSAAIAFGVVLILFGVVQFVQKKSIKDLTADIETQISETQKIEDLDEILTIQNQLNTLPGLHQTKPTTSRLIGYLYQLTPVEIKIGNVKAGFEVGSNTLIIEGLAPSLALINQYADTLKFSTVKVVDLSPEDGKPVPGTEQELKPFLEVLTELNRGEAGAYYVLRTTYDPIIFDNTKRVTLVVPSIVTTRSTVNKPSISNEDTNPLFEEIEKPEEQEE